MKKIFFCALLMGTLIFETNAFPSVPSSETAIGARGGGGGGRGGGLGGGPRGGGIQGRPGVGRMGPHSNVGPRGGYYSNRFNRAYPYRYSPYFWNYGTYYDSEPSIIYDQPYMPPPPPPMYPPMYQVPQVPPAYQVPQQPMVIEPRERPEPSLPTYTPSKKPDIVVYPPSPSGSTAMPKEAESTRDLDIERTILIQLDLGNTTIPLQVAVDDIYAKKIIKLDRGPEGIYFIVPCNEGNMPVEKATENGYWKWNLAAPNQFCGFWLWVPDDKA